MRRAEALAILDAHRTDLEPFGVKSLAIFGSVARNEAGPDSDVDILVEFNRPIGMFGFLDFKEYLESILGQTVDLVMRDAVKPRLRDRILAEAVHAA